MSWRSGVPSLRLEHHDQHPGVIRLAAAGLLLAAAMAVVGLPPIDLHGPGYRYGVMDPLCGGTRAVRLAARGEWAAAWRFNPLGPVLVVGAVLLMVRTAVGALSGRWVNAVLPRRRVVIAAVVVAAVVLQVRQQLSTDLLVAS